MIHSDRHTIRPGHALSIEGLTFEGFPRDGRLWWLRWWDYGGATATSGSSFLHLLFARLPAGTRADALPMLDALAAEGGDHRRAEVHVGWLPVLRIGLVVQDGMVVGKMGSHVRRFRFQRDRDREQVELLLEAEPRVLDRRRRRRLMTYPSDPAFEFGSRPGLLRPDRYPLPSVKNGRLLCFGPKKAGSDPVLAVPCAEVVRVTYASHASLARAVVDQAWSRGVRRVLDMDQTAVLADGAGWQVAPMTRLQAEHSVVAANLALNPVARRRANLIFNEIRSERGGVLTALLPFEWRVLQIDVACLSLSQDGRGPWLGYSIEALQWPPAPLGPPGKLTLVPKDDRRAGTERLPGVAKAGLRGMRRGPLLQGPRPRAVQHTDPAKGRQQDVVLAGAAWLNAPQVEKAEKASSVSQVAGARSAKRTPALLPEELAAAEPGRSRTGPKPADPQSRSPESVAGLPSLHFDDVLAMLQGLAASGTIQEVEIEVAEGPELEMRGDLAAWGFPTIPVPRKGIDEPLRRWFMRDFSWKLPSGEYSEPVLRAAMVCRIVVDGKVAYWIETEPRSYNRDNYRSLVFSVSGVMGVGSVIRQLLAIAAERAGVWPPAVHLCRLVSEAGQSGISRCVDWQHVRLKQSRMHSDVPFPLSSSDALAAIRQVTHGG